MRGKCGLLIDLGHILHISVYLVSLGEFYVSDVCVLGGAGIE